MTTKAYFFPLIRLVVGIIFAVQANQTNHPCESVCFFNSLSKQAVIWGYMLAHDKRGQHVVLFDKPDLAR